jgi:hypothetical protein
MAQADIRDSNTACQADTGNNNNGLAWEGLCPRQRNLPGLAVAVLES